MKMKIKNYLIDKGIKFHSDHKIGEYLTMHIGGKVGFIIFSQTNEELIDILQFLHPLKQKVILIGGGSNIIFPDSCDSLIVLINRASGISRIEKNILKVDTGLKNTEFLEYCKKENINGFEFLAGIPGTIGGATAVNAGAFGNSISDKITGGDIFTEGGNIEYKEKNFFDFEYRNSRFKFGNDIILNIYLEFETGKKELIREKINEIIRLRTKKHPPYSAFTAGCFFKNPEVNGQKLSAGRIIESCDLKGYDAGNVMVSDKHSNFLVNKGHAVFSEIESLGEKIQETVKQMDGILLEREVIFVSPEGKKF